MLFWLWGLMMKEPMLALCSTCMWEVVCTLHSFSYCFFEFWHIYVLERFFYDHVCLGSRCSLCLNVHLSLALGNVLLSCRPRFLCPQGFILPLPLFSCGFLDMVSWLYTRIHGECSHVCFFFSLLAFECCISSILTSISHGPLAWANLLVIFPLCFY